MDRLARKERAESQAESESGPDKTARGIGKNTLSDVDFDLD
jgi:hypothetical protein